MARIAVVSAWVIPGVLAGVIWKILLIENRSGIVNYYLGQVGLGPLPLISSPVLALVSVIVANVWRGCAFSMILLYAGLQRVPRELHEAADLEGVSAWQRLRWLLIPQLAPVIALNLVLITIASFNTFDLIIPLTGGGPARRTEVISLFMYRLGFFDLQAGRAAAVAVVMLVVNLMLAWVAGRLIMRDEHDAARGGRVVIATARQRALFVLGLIAIAAAFLLPQLWLFSLSLKNKAGLFEYPPTWIPKGGSLANYTFVLTHSQVPWYLWNSLVVAAFASAATLARGRARRLRAVARSLPGTPAAARRLARGADGVAGDPAGADLRHHRAAGSDRHAGGLDPGLRRDAGSVHRVGPEEFLRRRAAVDLRGGPPRRRDPRAHLLDDRAAGHRSRPGRHRGVQPGGVLVGVLPGAGAAGLAGALHHAARTVQLPERLRHRLAPARRGELRRAGAGDYRLRAAATLLRRRPHRRRSER